MLKFCLQRRFVPCPSNSLLFYVLTFNGRVPQCGDYFHSLELSVFKTYDVDRKYCTVNMKADLLTNMFENANFYRNFDVGANLQYCLIAPISAT